MVSEREIQILVKFVLSFSCVFSAFEFFFLNSNCNINLKKSLNTTSYYSITVDALI